MRDHAALFRVSLLGRVLSVSRSGYYAWRCRSASHRDGENARLLVHIRLVYGRSRGSYGSPRVTEELRDQGFVCNEKRVARLMRVHGIRSKSVRKFRATTDSRHSHPVSPNVVDRSFVADGPNRVWLADLTYIWTGEGWLYLAAVLDMYSRRVVGLATGPRIDGELALRALRQAAGRRQPAPGLVHHSDRGVQYACRAYRKLLSEYRMIGSMSRKGDCWDNAPMESFFGTLKQELVFQRRFATRAEAAARLFEYIEVFYNGQRRHSSLGWLSPVDYERAYDHKQQKETDNLAV